MAELLVQFDEPSCGVDGRLYIAQVHGQLAADDLWEAWIEFVPIDGGDPIWTARETEQFSRGDLRYWAARLTREYLEGALGRALTHSMAELVPVGVAGVGDERRVFETDVLMRARAVLDPFLLYRQNGVAILRQELRSLEAKCLQDIIAAYQIPELDPNDMLRTFEDALAEQIVAEVQHRVGSSRLEEVGSGAQTR